MKLLKILILMIGVNASSACSTTKYKIIHKSLELSTPCVFVKFTETEIQSMSEAVGRKIDHNHQNCEIQHKKNNGILAKHNELHQDN